jgi:hypothetical protein
MALALSVSGAFAANDAAPLAPAKPAGVQKAQMFDSALLTVLGIGAAVAILGITLSNASQTQNATVSTQ